MIESAGEERQSFAVALVLLGTVTLARLVYVAHTQLDLAPDEAHYWEWSRRLDWGYYSKGPVVAWLIALSTRLGGDTAFFVRLPAVLLSFATGLLVYCLANGVAERSRAGLLAIVAIATCPLYAVGAVLMTIDAPFVFCWTAAVYAFLRASGGAHASIAWWMLAGVALGLGILSKYAMLLWLPCVAIAIAARPELARRRGLCAALALAALIATPLVVWNARHDWISIRHTAVLAGLTSEADAVSLRTFGDFLGGQLGVVSPLLLIALIVATIRACDPGRREFLAFAFSAPVLLFFLVWSLHEKIEANWSAPAYAPAFALLGADWDRRIAESRSPSERRRTIMLVVAALIVGGAISMFAYAPELADRLGIRVPPRLDPTTRLWGWKQLGSDVGAVVDAAGDRPIVADGYQLASELAFYLPGRPRVYVANFGRRLNQYDLWGGLAALAGRRVWLVTSGRPPDALVASACGRFELVKVIETERRGEPVRATGVFDCDGFRGPKAGFARY